MLDTDARYRIYACDRCGGNEFTVVQYVSDGIIATVVCARTGCLRRHDPLPFKGEVTIKPDQQS